MTDWQLWWRVVRVNLGIAAVMLVLAGVCLAVLVWKARKKHQIRIRWTCSNFVHHEHRTRAGAWLCGRLQYWHRRLGERGKR